MISRIIVKYPPPTTYEELESFRLIVSNAVFWTSGTDDSETDTDKNDDLAEIPPTISDICKLNIITNIESFKNTFE